ncbi:Pimeloyl-ACP methyl ester carboxylesterase [Devosia enhydra]|uniref:Pimeloyl-ACP methyl ester carboxylesterase n=1 Tax=Devosia enhydra TaxID=665118 RepID=A0A1K2HT07_9HYPH|nr:alpha/beta hydrolase [Devosia enhydra]SFZ80785.1 Pimeloyl-ACP methyl ester carboxylesterase [Devosia enhydra]
MPLLAILRFAFALFSVAVYGASAYLLWQWYQGDIVQVEGALIRTREDWHLWVGLLLLAWGLSGKFLWRFMLAKPDQEEPTKAQHGVGRQIASSTGSSLFVEEVGPENGPIIIFTHGAACNSTVWQYAKRQLADQFRLVLWDLPGLGRSIAVSGQPLGPNHYAADLADLLTSLGQPVVLVGHSMGGMTIQTLFGDFPALADRYVRGAVLVNTTYTNPLKTMILPRVAQAIRFPLIEPLSRLAIGLQPLAWLFAWQSYLSGSAHIASRFGFGKFVTRSQLEHATILSTRNAPGSIARGNLDMFRWDASATLHGLNKPTLVLAGELDIVTKPNASVVIATTAPRAQLTIIAGVNHMGFMEQSRTYNDAIAAFVRSLG